MNHHNMTPQQRQQMYQQQMAQNPHLQAQIIAQQQQLQRQQMAMQHAASYGMQGGQQHLQPQFAQQRRPSPMGQMPISQPGQQNPMMGFGGMPPPSSAGPMNATMQPGMHPNQQAFQQQQFMQANNQFGMTPTVMGGPMGPSTPNRPPSQMHMSPSPGPPGTPTNVGRPNGMTPPGHQPPGMSGSQMMTQAQPQQQLQQQHTPQPQLHQQPQQPHQQSHQQPNQQQVQTPVKANDATKDSGGDASTERMKQRIDTLLELNVIMIRCIMDISEQGKTPYGTKPADGQAGGQQSPTSSTPTDPANPANSEAQSPSQASNQQRMNSWEWAQFLRRLQSNIHYLMGGTVGPNSKRPLWPNLMDIHPMPPGAVVTEDTYKELKELYQRLREAFPEYKPSINPMTGQPGAMHPGALNQAPGGRPLGMMGPPGAAQQGGMQRPPQNEVVAGGA